jgi:LPXTG-motif cell wall-anchored protein
MIALSVAGVAVCLARVFVVTGYPQAQMWSAALGLAGLVAAGVVLKRTLASTA